MSATKAELKNTLKGLSGESTRIVLKFARWLAEQEDELTKEELSLLMKGEKEFEKGEYVWWRDVKRTEI
ncbi:hypothetical protein KAW65_00630 [candidate division WOR-3 bacterium]|nr:hypothetical protein [candidate division WOR-3 bacterium]